MSQPKNPRIASLSTIILSVTLFVVMSLTDTWAASKQHILFSFAHNARNPTAGLTFDSSGNLYGTSSSGSAQQNCPQKNCGTVFELVHGANGRWTLSILHTFSSIKSPDKNGAVPVGDLVFDAAGNLYGATRLGGNFGGTCGRVGCGTVFELIHGQNNMWTFNVLHRFNFDDGSFPEAGLIVDSAGNLYGTTREGGSAGWGTVFQLTPGSGGQWTEQVLHSFNNTSSDGAEPLAPVIFDNSGNLFGTTYTAGSNGGGVVFELTNSGHGQWTEQIVHNFPDGSTDGWAPLAGLVVDNSGSLYGTTAVGGQRGGKYCGTLGCGVVFQLTPGSNGQWSERILHKFRGDGKDGFGPNARLAMDNSTGTLYGTTPAGGPPLVGPCLQGCGLVFELTPGSNGRWTEKILHSFQQNKIDGIKPMAGVILDPAGKNVFGTTQYGGRLGWSRLSSGNGAIFQITP